MSTDLDRLATAAECARIGELVVERVPDGFLRTASLVAIGDKIRKDEFTRRDVCHTFATLRTWPVVEPSHR
jgi:hypothetical protein